jgi:uncharacterized Rossmann fold enzyme
MAMLYETWEPAYDAIREAFGYDREADVRSRDSLHELVAGRSPLGLESLALPGTVAVCGAGPSLRDELDVARGADAVVAASSAAETCLDTGVTVDCMVTDLDGAPDTAGRVAAGGTPVAVHAHGDNVEAIRRHLPELPVRSVLPTTQAAPRRPVGNHGGFTDGDRAALLADAVGADRLLFPGWDFDDPTVDAEKARKLAWAERILHWLERRRTERFPLLHGRRDAIEFPWI